MRGTPERRRLVVAALATVAGLVVGSAAAAPDVPRAVLLAGAQLFAVAAAAAVVGRAEHRTTRRLFGVAMLLHGVVYLLYPAGAWNYPVAAFWALGGAGLVTGVRARETATTMVLLLAAWLLLVRWPAVVWSPASPTEWTGLAVAAIMCATAGLLARPVLQRALHRFGG